MATLFSVRKTHGRTEGVGGVSVTFTIPSDSFVKNRHSTSSDSQLHIESKRRAVRLFSNSPRVLRTFYTRIHNRVHVKPTFNNLGTIADNVAYSLIVWNAHYFKDFTRNNTLPIQGDNLTLGYNGVIEGDLLRGTVDGNYLVTVTFIAGESGLLAVGTLVFDPADNIGESYSFPITLSVTRGGIVWSIPPNTGEVYGEKFKWMTDIVMFEGGEEQRASLKDYPSLAIEATYSAKDVELQLLNSLMWGWQGKEYYFPLWHKRQRLRVKAAELDTTLFLEDSLEFSRITEGSMVILWLSPFRWQLATVQSIVLEDDPVENSYRITIDPPLSFAVPRGTHVMPVREGTRMEKEVKGQSPTANLTAYTIRFSMRDDEEYPALDSGLFFEDTYVLDMQPNWADPMDESVSRDIQELRSEVGEDYFYDRNEAPAVVRGFYFWFNQPSKIDQFMKWLYARRGAAVPFWLPTGKSDMQITSDVSDPLERQVYVKFIKAATMYADSRAGREAVLITLKNGTKIAKRIKSIEYSGVQELIKFTTAIGTTFSASQVREVNFMGKNRLSSDEITLQWQSDKLVIASSNMTTLRGE